MAGDRICECADYRCADFKCADVKIKNVKISDGRCENFGYVKQMIPNNYA